MKLKAIVKVFLLLTSLAVFSNEATAHCAQIFSGGPSVRVSLAAKPVGPRYSREKLRTSAKQTAPQPQVSGSLPPLHPLDNTVGSAPKNNDNGILNFLGKDRRGDLQRELTLLLTFWSAQLQGGSLDQSAVENWHAFRKAIVRDTRREESNAPEVFAEQEFGLPTQSGGSIEFGPQDAVGEFSTSLLVFMVDALVSAAETRQSSKIDAAMLEAVRRLVVDKQTLQSSPAIMVDGRQHANVWELLDRLTGGEISAAEIGVAAKASDFVEQPPWLRKRVLGQSGNVLSIETIGEVQKIYFESPFDPIVAVTVSRSGFDVEDGDVLWRRYIDEVDEVLTESSTDQMLLASVLVRPDGNILINLPTGYNWPKDTQLESRCSQGAINCQIRINVDSEVINDPFTRLASLNSTIAATLEQPDSPLGELVELLRASGSSLTLYSHPLQEASGRRLSAAFDFVSRLQTSVPEIDVLIDDFGPELEAHVAELVAFRPMTGEMTLLVPSLGYGRPFDGFGNEVRKIESVSDSGLNVLQVDRRKTYEADDVNAKSVVVLTAHNDDDFNAIIEDFGAKGLFRDRYVVLFACGINVSSAQVAQMIGLNGARGVFNFNREIRPDIAGDAIRDLSRAVGRNNGRDLNELLVRSIRSAEKPGSQSLSGAWVLCG